MEADLATAVLGRCSRWNRGVGAEEIEVLHGRHFNICRSVRTSHQSPAAVLKSGALNIDIDYAKCGGVEMTKLWATVAGLIAMWTGAPSVGPSKVVTGTAYDFAFSGIDGKPLQLADWRGKVLLVVNTASFCGYTKQYAGLQELWTRYEKAGLVVIGVPSNDFGGQEPKSEGEIKSFCQGAFGVTFPLTSKQVVIGSEAHPFYKWAADAIGPKGLPNWNFHKYLIGRDGRLLRSLSTRLAPASEEVTSWIEKALAEHASQGAALQN
jgi:glutathione peroxidase